MAEKKPHLFLKNEIKSIERFPKRGIPPTEQEDEEIVINKYERKKRNLRQNLRSFNTHIQERHRNRTLEIPDHIDYVKIYSHSVFNADLQKKFRESYGLSAVRFESFNKIILCSIADEDKFEIFKNHITFFVRQEQGFDPLGTDYFLLVHIDKFELLSSDKIKGAIRNEEVIIEIINNTDLPTRSNNIEKALAEFLNREKGVRNEFNFEVKLDYSFIVLRNVNEVLINKIIDNFDVIYKVQSHTYKTGPNRYNWPNRRPDFQINPKENTTLVGIIDTGIQQNSPLRDIIENYQYDISNSDNPLPILDHDGHGTSIALLAALGTEFYESATNTFQSQIKVVPIKVLENSNGNYSLIEFENVIRKAAANNIRIFNLSINESCCKLYNQSVSEQAYLMDKLAHKLDILFFISTGNMDSSDMQAMQNDIHTLHQYPNHFYNPFRVSEIHSCEFTNIHSPAESFNNVSVGAIAENFNSNPSDLTYAKELPAFYSKKFHLNFVEKVNGVFLSQSLINKNIFKPDLVAPGGDALNTSSGMEVLSIRTGNLTELSYGTSNAAPLTANIAARILNKYPDLKTQTIKALLINSAELDYNSSFLNELIENIKSDFAIKLFEKQRVDLGKKEKYKLDRMVSEERLFKYLTGHGRPNSTKALYSDDNSVTMVIEETISVDSHKGLFFKIPEYLNDLTDKEKKSVLSITATLCYSFDPIFSNFIAYNPLHISFAFFNPVDEDLEKSIDLIAGYSRQEKEQNLILKEQVESAKSECEIKKSITWSEDYLGSKLFSNTQKLMFPLRILDLNKIENTLNILVRCTCKKDIDPEIVNHLKRAPHPFSLAIRIEEKAIENSLSGNLYNELLESINTLEAIAEADLEAEVEN